jgi:hypothetical protein
MICEKKKYSLQRQHVRHFLLHSEGHFHHYQNQKVDNSPEMSVLQLHSEVRFVAVHHSS